ncbi:MAG: hypothetical protein H7A21_19765 [Spirochaetales bacterium]|nr:hypothetical protein [Leptospiraceae bacterium]MCP5483685.1 hypothetical protein [Spirochaetales bacterium]
MPSLLKKHARGVVLGLLVALAPGSAQAEPVRDVRGDQTVDYWSRYGRVELEADRILYRPGQDIPIRFRIRNVGYSVIRVYPHIGPGKTYQFMLLDSQGREQTQRFNAASYNNREHGERAVVDQEGDPIKEVILHPGETLEKVIFLNDFYRLTPGSEYRLVGYFYPDQRFEYFVRSENNLVLRIDQERSDPFLRPEVQSLRPDGAPVISPEETVYLFLSAEMRRNWPNYLKYLDLRKFITAYDRFAGRFATASVREQPVILDDFARYLTGNPADELRRFRITATEPERDRSGEVIANGRNFVTVEAVRIGGGYTARYEYRYTLEPSSDSPGMWKIVYVEARLVR